VAKSKPIDWSREVARAKREHAAAVREMLSRGDGDLLETVEAEPTELSKNGRHPDDEDGDE